MSTLPPLKPLEPFEPYVASPSAPPGLQRPEGSVPTNETADGVDAVEGTEPAGDGAPKHDLLATCDAATPIGELQIARRTEIDPNLAKVATPPIARSACCVLGVLCVLGAQLGAQLGTHICRRPCAGAVLPQVRYHGMD